MIIFKTLRYKNLLSSGNSFIELNLNENKSTILIGDNGSGKSTILDALSFGLYNKAFRNINKPQLINSINQKNLVVEVDFIIGPNEYKIIRGMRPNIFEIYMNGKLINQDDRSRDYQDNLEKNILKMTHKSFCQIVTLGSSSYTPFMKLPAAARREIIEDLLDQGIFTIMNILNKNDISETQNDILDNEYQIKIITNKIDMHKKHLQAFQQNTLEMTQRKLLVLEQCETQKKEAEEENNFIDETIENLNNSKLDEISIEKKLKEIHAIGDKIQNRIDKAKKELKFFANNESCPTCFQAIGLDFKDIAKAEREKLIETLLEGLNDLSIKNKEFEDRANEIKTINSEISQRLTEKAVLRSTISNLSKQINSLRNEIQTLSEKLPTISSDGEQYEHELKIEENRKEELIVRADMLKDASVILKDNGIKARIIKQYIPIINKLINKYLAAMEFFVSFELDETFSEKIKSRHRDEFSYESFSEGEKMKINLAILFTWRAIAKLRNSASTNLLIMDEVFDSSLDATGTEEFMKILNNLTQDTNTFVISHKGDSLIDKFENVIKFEKYKDFSRIVG